METSDSPIHSSIVWDKSKLFIKAVIIIVMALGLWLPTSFILGTIRERKQRRDEVITDITNKWAGRQTISGPLLMIPYIETIPDEKGKPATVKRAAYFMPDKLDIRSVVHPEKRHRGIYEVVVYRSEVSLQLKFKAIQWQLLKVPGENIVWNEAMLVMGIQDQLKGINEDVYVKWRNNTIPFNANHETIAGLKDALVSGVPLTPELAATENIFSVQFGLNGSEQLLFTAAARENNLEIRSTWPHPSFTGVKLPEQYKVNDSGFVANWKYMNRLLPAIWKDSYLNLSDAMFGANLLTLVDSYDKTERSVKYALLCFVLTFAAFFLIEMIYKKAIHLIQYGLVGLALALFYTLLLSISEYTGFNIAYLIAGIATIGLVVWYVGSILRSSNLAMFITFVLSVVYAYIFIIIQLQDFSLLMGSIGLFVALATVMYFSRRLQWTRS